MQKISSHSRISNMPISKTPIKKEKSARLEVIDSFKHSSESETTHSKNSLSLNGPGGKIKDIFKDPVKRDSIIATGITLGLLGAIAAVSIPAAMYAGAVVGGAAIYSYCVK